MEYIYIIKLREFKLLNQEVYKIGRSSRINCQRTMDYPKQSDLICINSVDNCLNSENKLMEIFKYKFKQRADIGKEYFEGDIDEMKHILNNLELCDDEGNITIKKLQKNNSTSSIEEDTIDDTTIDEDDDEEQENEIFSISSFKNNKINKNEHNNKDTEKYKCEDCNYFTNRLSSYKRHFISKKHMLQVNNKIDNSSITKKQFKCKYCKLVYTDRSNKSKHYKTCKVKKGFDINEQILKIEEDQKYKNIENELNLLKKENELLKLELSLLKQN